MKGNVNGYAQFPNVQSSVSSFGLVTGAGAEAASFLASFFYFLAALASDASDFLPLFLSLA